MHEAPETAARDHELLALRQRAEVYERRAQFNPDRLRALGELAAEAQELKLGYV